HVDATHSVPCLLTNSSTLPCLPLRPSRPPPPPPSSPTRRSSDLIPLAQRDAPDAVCAAAGGTHVGLIKADGHPVARATGRGTYRSEEHTSELQSHLNLVCRLRLDKKKTRRHGAHPSRCRCMPPCV